MAEHEVLVRLDRLTRRFGTLTAVDPQTGAVRFTTQVSPPVSRFVSLAAAGGRLVVADGNRIAAFSLR